MPEKHMLGRAIGLIANASGDEKWEAERREFLTACNDISSHTRPARVDGRHTECCLRATALVAKVRKREGFLEVRIEDSNHPDFWMEVEIPDESIVSEIINEAKTDGGTL